MTGIIPSQVNYHIIKYYELRLAHFRLIKIHARGTRDNVSEYFLCVYIVNAKLGSVQIAI